MKVVSTSPSFAMYSDSPIKILEEHGIRVVRMTGQIQESELAAELRDADAWINGYSDVGERILEQAPLLKIVCKHGVGVDNIDLEATNKRKIWVTNVPDGNKMAVADYAFALMLSSARSIPIVGEQTKQGKWPRIVGAEIYGKTLGVIGLGRIGKEVVRRAKGFDMEIMAYDPFPDTEFAEANKVKYTTLDNLLSQSDFITLHMSLNEQTSNLIGKLQLDIMKSTAYLINVSRGGVINEQALYEALAEGKIAGAALDVFAEEPIIQHPLLSLPNFIGTSHVAGYTHEAITNLGTECARNIVDVLVHEKRPNHVVNSL